MKLTPTQHFVFAVVWVFCLMVFVDFFWARYISDAATGKALAASVWATLLFASSGYVTAAYVKNKWLLIPASIGAFVGTYAGVIFR